MDQVKAIAEQIAASLADVCENIVVAGSIRREAAMVGDIELVAIPKIETQASLVGSGEPVANALHQRLDKLMKEQKIHPAQYPAWGDKQRKFIVRTGAGYEYQVDLYMCEPNQFGSIFLIRTGSADFSRWIVTKKDMDGAMPADMRQAQGRLWRKVEGDWEVEDNWEPVPTFTEQQYFDAIRLPWIPPDKRHNDEWLVWLAELEEWLRERDGEITW